MTSINTFDANVYSEEMTLPTEQEFDSVMAEMASDQDGWQGYGEWSAAVEAESENLYVRCGKVYHKPEPASAGRLDGVEL